MIAIIDYKAGNLSSVERALKKLGYECRITQRREEILSCERIIFPGVGAAGKAMSDLKRLGLDEVLRYEFNAGKPILGICLGAQIVLERSRENEAECLGLIEGTVELFPQPLFSEEKDRLKIPHMGWNRVNVRKEHPVLEGIAPADEFYFVHAYYPLPASDEYVFGTTCYGIEFASVIGYNSLIAMQFHPEKSGKAGLRLLENFCTWDGRYAE
ncbi:MAG: imidazole glycerol phosphate synthase subunit HisH [Desulfobacterales bacterium]